MASPTGRGEHEERQRTWWLAELPVRAGHATAAARLPTHHADPFDRVLVAQTQLEGLVCVTRDPAFEAYGVATLW